MVLLGMNGSVSRIDAKSENYDTELTLDINSEIYPLKEGYKFEILLSDRLHENPSVDTEVGGYDPSQELDSRAESFEYIMHGKIFKYAEEKARAYVDRLCLFVLVGNAKGILVVFILT